ncbi:MAG: mechanosensitive ion channel [Pseudomonadales bacterium]|nr:mechanosensitive ion channel [Pseudomonadales bacterium]
MDQELAQVTEIYNMIVTYLVTYSFQILGAMVILVVGFMIARRVSSWLYELLQRKKLDVTLSRFFASCARIAIVASAIMIALPKLGIQITPFIAAIGALSLGAGLAVQGLLSNYGAGLSIILTRPFVVGDTIRVQGVWGVVKEVHLAYTLLTNEDGEIITIPNKHIIGEIIHNSQADTILELVVGVAYDSDIPGLVKGLKEALSTVEGLSKEREVQVGILNFADSAIELEIRCWVRTEQFHQLKFVCNDLVHQVIRDMQVSIPFPQREVRMLPEQ